MDVFWLKEESLEDSDNLPSGVVASEIVGDLEAALEQMGLIVEDLWAPIEGEAL